MADGREKRLMQLAAKQLGLVSWRDCAALGFSVNWLRSRVKTGAWLRLFRGVFKIGADPASPDQLEVAALLAAGEGAVLSHESAAAKLGLDVPRAERIQITIPAARCV